MPFLTYTGTVDFDLELDPTVLPLHLGDCLRQKHASTVEVSGNHVEFTAGMFRLVSNWNVLVPFGFGDLAVDPKNRQVRYSVSFRQLTILATGMVGLMAAFILFGSPSEFPLVFIPIMWAWFVGGNLLIGVPRFQSFLRRSISTAPRVSNELFGTGTPSR